jgi:hypothetical protein
VAELPIRVELSAETEKVARGEVLPVRVRVTNTGSGDLWFVGCLDGSEAGYRYPRYTPRISGPEEANLGEGPFWCGTVVPLRVEDFVRLAPDQSFDPTEPVNGAGFQPLFLFTRYTPSTPGRYELSLAISTESASPEEWGVIPVDYPGKREIEERLAQVPRGVVESNRLTVEVG